MKNKKKHYIACLSHCKKPYSLLDVFENIIVLLNIKMCVWILFSVYYSAHQLSISWFTYGEVLRHRHLHITFNVHLLSTFTHPLVWLFWYLILVVYLCLIHNHCFIRLQVIWRIRTRRIPSYLEVMFIH